MQSIITPLFCENDLLIPVHLRVNVSAQRGYSGNFLTFLHPLIYCDFYILWYMICLKSHIEIKNIFLCHAIVCHFLINDTDERGSKNAILQSDVLFEWPLIKFLDRLMLPIYICLLKVKNIEQMRARWVGNILNLITILW